MEGGAGDYAALGAAKQRDAAAAGGPAGLDDRLGRRPSAIPSHLSRVLYIPKHGSSRLHLPIYEVSDEFRRAVGDASIGSSMFTTKLALMKPPSGEGTDGNVVFLIDINKQREGDIEEGTATIQRRALGDINGGLTMHFPLDNQNEDFRLSTGSGGSQSTVPVAASYPVSDTVIRGRAFRHPWYTFAVGSTKLQWQAHPVAHGPMRYTLVKVDEGSDISEAPDVEDAIVIYHHTWSTAQPLSNDTSEGVLLMPETLDIELEMHAIGSLIGLLWQIRRLAGGGDQKMKGGKAREKGLTSKIFKVFHKGS